MIASFTKKDIPAEPTLAPTRRFPPPTDNSSIPLATMQRKDEGLQLLEGDNPDNQGGKVEEETNYDRDPSIIQNAQFN